MLSSCSQNSWNFVESKPLPGAWPGRLGTGRAMRYRGMVLMLPLVTELESPSLEDEEDGEAVPQRIEDVERQ